MAKTMHDDTLDGLLNYIANNGDKMFLCSDQPTNWTEANSTYKLAVETLTLVAGGADYTIDNDPVNGRRLVVTAQAAVSVTGTGTGTHLVIGDSATSKVLHVDTISPGVAVTSGNTVTMTMGAIRVADPT